MRRDTQGLNPVVPAINEIQVRFGQEEAHTQRDRNTSRGIFRLAWSTLVRHQSYIRPEESPHDAYTL